MKYIVICLIILMYLNVTSCIAKNNYDAEKFENEEEREFTKASMTSLIFLMIWLIKNSITLLIITIIILIGITYLMSVVEEEKILKINKESKKITLKIVEKFLKLTPIAIILIIYLLIKKYI